MGKYFIIILIALAINGISILFHNDIASLIAVIITAVLLIYLMVDLTKNVSNVNKKKSQQNPLGYY
ncbi:hypothetical protein BS612_11475 [Listeria monocytogenes]|nr:hypothetical protein APY31_03175 [Listeria monocytogenes]ORI33659.1 hypothetical protein BS612_11475 [Listeria monocytogenes]